MVVQYTVVVSTLKSMGVCLVINTYWYLLRLMVCMDLEISLLDISFNPMNYVDKLVE